MRWRLGSGFGSHRGVVATLAFLAVSLFWPIPTALASDTMVVEPSDAPPLTPRELTAHGDFVNEHFSTFRFVLTMGGTLRANCDKKTDLSIKSRPRWVECSFDDPGVPGPHTIQLVALMGGITSLGPTTSFWVQSPETTTTAPPPSTSPTRTTATTRPRPPPTTAGSGQTPTPPQEETTTSALPTTTGAPETTTTQTSATTSASTSTTDLVPLAGADTPDGTGGGPSWVVLGLGVALAIAITVIVMQNLQRRDSG